MTTEVFDLDAAIAEAGAQPLTFRFKGEEYTLQPLQDLGIKGLDAIDSGAYQDVRTVMQEAMGADDWEAFENSGGGSIGALDQLFRQWVKHCGLDSGKSESAAASSPNMARQPRQTRSGRAGR